MITERSKDTSLCRKQSLLDEYLKNEALDIKDIVGMACDILLAGVDTVSFRAQIEFYRNFVRCVNRIANDKILTKQIVPFQTTHSTGFALYHLGRNVEAQEKLRSEAATLLPDPHSAITTETLRNASYTKAVIKETFRMNPISVGIGRILQTDVILSGYRVPRGVSHTLRYALLCAKAERW